MSGAAVSHGRISSNSLNKRYPSSHVSPGSLYIYVIILIITAWTCSWFRITLLTLGDQNMASLLGHLPVLFPMALVL